MSNIMEEMQAAVDSKNEEQIYINFMGILGDFFGCLLNHVDFEAAREEFRVKTGTEESGELDELFDAMIEGCKELSNAEEALDDVDEDGVLQEALKAFIAAKFLDGEQESAEEESEEE